MVVSKLRGQAKDIRKRHHEGENITSLARAYNVNRDTIMQVLEGHTFSDEGGPLGIILKSLTDTQVIDIRLRLAAGETLSDLLTEYNYYSIAVIINAATGKTFQHMNSTYSPLELPKRERSEANSKITKETRHQIYQYYQDGGNALISEIATRYGISESYVSLIRAGKR